MVDTTRIVQRAHPLPEENGPGPRPAVKIVPPLIDPVPLSDIADSKFTKDEDEVDPSHTMNLSGSLRLSKRPHIEPPTHAGPVILKSEPPPPSEPEKTSPLAPPSDSEDPARAASTIESDENESAWKETSFIVPPGEVSPASSISTGMISIRRKAKLTEVARIIPPSQPVEPEPPIAKGESSATVIPPAFTVAVPMVSVTAPSIAEDSELSQDLPDHAVEPAEEKEPTPAEIAPGKIPAPVIAAAPEPATAEKARIIPSEPETTKPAQPSEPITESVGTLADSSGKKEFLLANGERLLGRVLSETVETIYIDHDTLGVLTLPRAQIAQRPVEIILINGDRIVGDIMAETPDTLYVRHASLGMLTVPRAQRSTRVVEAILTDGDRILGEVLAETENFTVIRSATLGTVSVPHKKVTMLNCKIEQIELKALPPAAPELKDKTPE